MISLKVKMQFITQILFIHKDIIFLKKFI